MPIFYSPGVTIDGVDTDLDKPLPDLGTSSSRLGTVWSQGVDSGAVISRWIDSDNNGVRVFDGQNTEAFRVQCRSSTEDTTTIIRVSEDLAIIPGDLRSGFGRFAVHLNGESRMIVGDDVSNNQVPVGKYSSYLEVDGATGRVFLGMGDVQDAPEDDGNTVQIGGNLSLRNGLTPAELLLHGTYTDADNYERLRIYGNGTNYYLASEAAGTGVVRDIQVVGNLHGDGAIVFNNTSDDNQIGQLMIGYYSSSNPQLSSVGDRIHISSNLSFRGNNSNVLVDGTHISDLQFTHSRRAGWGFSFNTYRPSDDTWPTRFRVRGGDDATVSVTDATFSADGAVTFSGLPTADPTSAGQLWNDGGTLKISAG